MRNPYGVVHDRIGFSGKLFAPKIWKMDQKWGKIGFFLNLLKKLVIKFYLFCSVIKIYIIYCFPM